MHPARHALGDRPVSRIDIHLGNHRLEAFDRVYTYSAKPENLAPRPPTDSIVLRSYYDAVQSAFAELGGAELANYVATTEPPGVEIAAGVLVADAITAGNPRDW